MTESILLSDATTEAIGAAAAAFADSVKSLIAAEVGDRAGAQFTAAVSLQAAVRAQILATEPLHNKDVIAGAAEGVGLLIGLVEDPFIRMAMFNVAVSAAHTGMQAQAAIHIPAGEA